MRCAFLLTIAAVAVLASDAAASYTFTWDNPYAGPCQENCCCKTCSSPTAQSFPYGVIDETVQTNPPNPVVLGASCHVPVWSEQSGIRDRFGNLYTPVPDTLFWTSFDVFSDSLQRVAPTSCDCCRRSVDLACSETAPVARHPTNFVVDFGTVMEYTQATIKFEGGVALSYDDLIELRNDTFCGYGTPMYVRRSQVAELRLSETFAEMSWTIDSWPKHACYRLCYYQTNLTTPGWRYLGDVTVHQQPQTVPSFTVDPLDVVLEANSVTITYFGEGLLNVFDDVAELRTAGACGSGGAIASTASGTNGALRHVDGAVWCHPPPTPKITPYRPLQYIEPVYADCTDSNRMYLSRLRWMLTLPAAATYLMCYRRNGTWEDAGSGHIGQFVVPGQATAEAALEALHIATGASGWNQQLGWDSAGSACDFHGVRCDGSGNVVAVYLSRNGLTGTLPSAFFMSTFFNTITDLKLDMNDITGDIPREIGVFRNLKVLDIGNNQFTGTLPPTLARTQLQIFYATPNNFDGEVPSSLATLSQQWTLVSELQAPTVVAHAPRCPTDTLICTDRGSTDVGVTQCGHFGITEPECVIRGCCFNEQATLSFGGTACFTKKSLFFGTHPPCINGQDTCAPQVVEVV